GGANDLASLCWRILVVTNHDKRRFVPKLDFVTTPGYLSGPGSREAAGLPPGTGPYRVITDLAILGYDDDSSACRFSLCIPASLASRSKQTPALSWVLVSLCKPRCRPLRRNCTSCANMLIPTVTSSDGGRFNGWNNFGPFGTMRGRT